MLNIGYKIISKDYYDKISDKAFFSFNNFVKYSKNDGELECIFTNTIFHC